MRRDYDKVVKRGTHKYIEAKSGRLLSFFDIIRLADAAHSDFVRSISRAFKTLREDWDLEAIERRLDQAEEYITSCRRVLEERRKLIRDREKVEALRNTTGRTAEEAAAFRRKADELERKLEAAGA